MKTEKSYLVITRFVGTGKNITISLFNTLEEALKEAQEELKVEYLDSVEIYESDRADFSFFGKQIFEHINK